MIKIHIYADPGHAWGRVTKKYLINLGIEKDISKYSYVNGEYVYLEEDNDLNTFLKKVAPEPVQFVEHYTDRQSPIRNYKCYSFKTSTQKSFEVLHEKLEIIKLEKRIKFKKERINVLTRKNKMI